MDNVFKDNDQDVDYEVAKVEQPKEMNQQLYSDFGRSLNLSKRSLQKGCSFLKRYGMVSSSVRVSYYRNNQDEYQKYFKNRPDGISYCCDVPGLLKRTGFPTDPKDAR